MSSAVPHIFFCSNLDSPQDWQEALARHLERFIFTVGPACAEPDQVDVALVYKLPPGGLLRFTRLRAVISLSAGINQFDPAQLPANVPLSRSVDASLTRHMALYAKTAVLRYHRRFHLYEQDSRQCRWRFEPPLLPQQTSIGLLGMGELGKGIACALAAEGFRIHGWSTSPKEVAGVTTHSGEAGLHAMLAQSDMVINVLPLTDATRGILCSNLFVRFRKGTYLINLGRGGHVVEADLLQALAEGSIAGATLDVTSTEPLPKDHPLWGHPSVLITPHVAGLTTPATAAPNVAENVRRAMRGEALLNQVEMARGY